MMNAQLAEKEVNVWGGLVVKRVSLWGGLHSVSRVVSLPPPRLLNFTLGLIWVEDGGVEHSLWD